MRQFLVQLRPGARFTREEYQDFFRADISERTARMDILKLIEGGWVTKTGDGALTKYFKTNKILPDIAG